MNQVDRGIIRVRCNSEYFGRIVQYCIDTYDLSGSTLELTTLSSTDAVSSDLPLYHISDPDVWNSGRDLEVRCRVYNVSTPFHQLRIRCYDILSTTTQAVQTDVPTV